MGEVLATFVDRLGDERKIHRNRGTRLAVMRDRSTVPLALNRAVAPLIGKRIRKVRLAKGMTLEQLCLRAGLVAVSPKARMYEIEKGVRKEGMRFGTLYAIAIALGVVPNKLIPTVAEVLAAAGEDVRLETVERLVTNNQS